MKRDGAGATLSFASVDGVMLDGLCFCSQVYAMFNALSMQPDFQTRLRRRPTKFEKRLIEELVPLARYVQLNYTRGVNISLCWGSGSQTGEAIIRRSGLAVQWGERRAEGMLEVTQAAHKRDYLLRELLDTQGHSFAPDGISAEGKAHQGNRVVRSEAYAYSNNEAIVRQTVIVLDAIKAKAAKPYPDNVTLIVQVTLTCLLMPDEWNELVQGVRDNLPEHRFDEIWLLDASDRYYSRIPSLP